MNVICYVDGFNLYYGLKSKGWKKHYWLDVWTLAERFLLPNQILQELVYCTSRVKQNPPARKRQRAYIDALQAYRPEITILYGHYLAKEAVCRHCEYIYTKHEEKMTDVNIACQLLIDAVDSRFDTALLISGDSDLVPAIELIKKRFPAKQVIILFPPNRNSVDLSYSSHGYKRISESDLRQSQLPTIVQSAIDELIMKPETWI